MKPIPWFWLGRVLLSTVAVVVWGSSHPHASVWQLSLAGIVAMAVIEGLRWGYRQEQAEIAARRKRKDRLTP